MKKISNILALILLFSLFTPISGLAETKGFKDVSSNYTFYDEVLYLTTEKIITGFPDETFRPDSHVTRAQAAIMIGRALGLDDQPRNTRFKDVTSNVTGSGYIASAVDKGIITGFTDGTYRPDEPVTRGQMAIFLYRAFDLTGGSKNIFKDVTPNMAAYKAIINVEYNRIASGYKDGNYRPDQHVTRGQFSAFMARALDESFKPIRTQQLSLKVVDYYNQTQSIKGSVVDFSDVNGKLVKSVEILGGVDYTSVELPEGVYKLRVKAPGHDYYNYSSIELNGQTSIVFLMYGEAKIYGNIANQGTPVEGAVVKVFDRAGNEVWKTTTDATGYYSFKLNEGLYSIKVEIPGYDVIVKDRIDGFAEKASVVNFNIEETAEEQVEEPVVDPAEGQVEEPVQEPVEEPVDEPAKEPMTLLELNKPYVSADNEMTVTMKNIASVDKGEYYEYTLTYEEENNTTDKIIDQGSFKIYYQNGESEPQYGFFNRLYPGEKQERSYTFKALKSQEPYLIEYGADLFFKEAPTADTLKWGVK